MTRITAPYLVKWVNYKFKELEIEHIECYEVVRTRFLPSQYEAGACRLYIRFRSVTDTNISGYFLCLYSMKQLQNDINDGCELFLDFFQKGRQVFSLSEIELNLRRIKSPVRG